MTYEDFLKQKTTITPAAGITVSKDDINPQLFDFQRDIVRWSLKKGRSAIFAGCGLGKTPMQLAWAQHVHQQTQGDVLILAPLAVASQTVQEGKKFGIEVNLCRKQADINHGLNITNYEMLQHFEPSAFAGIVLDESSILKAYDGKTRNDIINAFGKTPFRLACTATPAPNDHMELGNHAEFLGVMTRAEMLSMFFVHDGGNTSKWRLKGHAVLGMGCQLGGNDAKAIRFRI
jgi:superfamily II DNA or RNA helicase